MHPQADAPERFHDILPFCQNIQGGNLFDYVRSADGGRLREGVARGFFQQLMSAVEYTERKGLGNRDLTMDNTLLVKKADGGVSLKISDFAYSIHDFDSGKKCKVGGGCRMEGRGQVGALVLKGSRCSVNRIDRDFYVHVHCMAWLDALCNVPPVDSQES